MTDATTTDPSLVLLSKMFAAATEHASVAMSGWTSGQVSLSLDKVQEVPLEEASSFLEMGDDLLTMVVLGIQGDFGGQLILTFDELNGRQLAAGLLGRDVNEESEWSALEQSAIMETGNILASAYLNELTRLTGHQLSPTAPHFLQDYGASVLEQAVMAQAMVSDHVMVCRTEFVFNNQAVNWNVVFVPCQELVDVMNQALRA